MGSYSRSLSSEVEHDLGIEVVDSPIEVARKSDAVSVHLALCKETRSLLDKNFFAALKPGSIFINTARGAVVREAEMIEVLRERSDITAVLDVTDPEPPEEGSPLYDLPNVILTPHIAGSMDAECHRMARYMVDELRRFIDGQPVQRRVSREQADRLA